MLLQSNILKKKQLTKTLRVKTYVNCSVGVEVWEMHFKLFSSTSFKSAANNQIMIRGDQVWSWNFRRINFAFQSFIYAKFHNFHSPSIERKRNVEKLPASRSPTDMEVSWVNERQQKIKGIFNHELKRRANSFS